MYLHPAKMLQKDQSVRNYRRSHPTHIIENTFGILVAREKIFKSTINEPIENVEKYVKPAVVLHN